MSTNDPLPWDQGAYLQHAEVRNNMEDLADNKVSERDEIRSLVPSEFQDFLDVFQAKEAKQLPPHRPYDHTIHLEKEAKLKLHPAYTSSDLVLIDIRRFSTTRPSKKLDYKRIGPFEVEGAVGANAYCVKIPSSIKIHPVFHIAYLESYNPPAQGKSPNQQLKPYQTIIADKEWEVACILDSKVTQKRNTMDWEPSAHLVNASPRFRP
ncbi:hypothetical protein I350_08377 [Cryptococcus amylolentus CBS 6273]|uniref:Tf2-1-like SH3-like domain-containing protein n=1 Tax=Cryptococcus amylolentus CBS 6273 TaxID=1296118 RepID=A0A1E3J659_9TREE|nr:hypothetical protein I350_08377 [Cryptococcus amylolentus CBS 6273]